MSQQFNKPSKGNNICAKYISTQYSRDAIYNSYSSETSVLVKQQKQIAGVFENIVKGVANALESTKTGWTVDSAFKEEENIKPVTILPQILSTVTETQEETWSPTNNNAINIYSAVDTPQTDQNVYYPVVFTDNLGRIWLCGEEPISNDNYNTILSIRCCQADGQSFETDVKRFTIASATSASGVAPYHIRPIAGASYLDINNKVHIKIFCICKNLAVGGNNKYRGVLDVIWETADPSDDYIQTATELASYSYAFDSNDWPIIKAQFDNALSWFIYLYYDDTNYCLRGGYDYHLPALSIAFNGLNSNDNFDLYVAGTFYYILKYINGECSIGTYQYNGNYYITSITNSWYSSSKSGQLKFFAFSTDLDFFVNVFCNDGNYDIQVRKQSEPNVAYYDTQLSLSRDKVLFSTGQNYLYINNRVDIVGEYTTYTNQLIAIDFIQQQIKPYVDIINNITIDSIAWYKKLLLSGHKETNPVLININNFVPVASTVEEEENKPLCVFINLTHSSGSKLQLSCVANGKSSNLRDNTGHVLFQNDIGFTYVSKDYNYTLSTSDLEENLPSFHICTKNYAPWANGLYIQEIISGATNLHDIEYYITASKDGQFLSLMVKRDENIIANIGCGDLIKNLQYPLYDTSPQAHTLYYSLGFVPSEFSGYSVPESNTMLVSVFVAPTYNGFRFYGGLNADTRYDLQYACLSYGYQYLETPLAIGQNVYTMPIMLNITGTSPIYRFNNDTGVKGMIDRKYLVNIKGNSMPNSGNILDSGNYLYLNNGWAIGWDASNIESNNPYYTEE